MWIDDTIILELLEQIARETDDGSGLPSEQLAPGRSRQEVRRHLRVIRDEDWINYIGTAHLQDPDAMFIKGLTPAGWGRLEELTPRDMPEAERLEEAGERYVDLDHSSAEWQRAIDALEKLASAIRASNEYAAREPEDQDQRLGEVEAATVLMKRRRVAVAAITATAGRAARYLTRKFGDTGIGLAAKEAWEWILGLLS